jgi:integrase
VRPCCVSRLEDDYAIRAVQELLGHASVEMTMVYTHVLNRGGRGVRSPLDGLDECRNAVFVLLG